MGKGDIGAMELVLTVLRSRSKTIVAAVDAAVEADQISLVALMVFDDTVNGSGQTSDGVDDVGDASNSCLCDG